MFAKVYGTDDKQVLLHKDEDADDGSVIVIMCEVGTGNFLSLQLAYGENTDKRDERFAAVTEEFALSMAEKLRNQFM